MTVLVRPFLYEITHDADGRRVGHDYVRLDDALRAEMYQRTTGISTGWPIPLTPCTTGARQRP